METCQYNVISGTKRELSSKEIFWKPFCRQLFLCSALWMSYFSAGLCLGAPTVVIPQIRRQISHDAISEEMASWLSSAMTYSTLPWVIILLICTRFVGRRPPYIFAIFASIISFIILYKGTNVNHFLISQLIQGILFGCDLTVSTIMVSEYVWPKYRGTFLTLKAASLFWGVWVSNAIGTFFHWNYIGLFGLICSCYYVTVFFWSESPYWLASQGRFEECIKGHRWLKGEGPDSEKELEKLLESQKEFLKNSMIRVTVSDRIKTFAQMFTLKEFYKPVLLSILMFGIYHSLGKLVVGMYSIEMIKSMTDSEAAAYTGMLIVDGVSVLGLYIGCACSTFLKRRTLLLGENKILTIALLSAYSMMVAGGPTILSTSIYGELVPLRFKSSGVTVIILVHFSTMATLFKIAPLIFKTVGVRGTFLLYATVSSFFAYLLYRYLPETKDKTLQEIEAYFKDDKPQETVIKELTPFKTKEEC
ncbi:facilitated trehalose transporter Tret1-like [Hyposmocoma kahamanoa]|uniref:facilitated trehalose transporter Tret1-like n=1 Tax=Hyposmocoma kahamanoa TaxID=1477025 RepID=UPI000E6D7F66|nr:facilitated trehalose transporter Tret1-like [Hyposmocoma kahamanoa]